MANGREWGKRIQEVREIQSVETMYKLHKSFFRFFVLPTHVLMSAESHTHTISRPMLRLDIFISKHMS